MVVVVVDVVLLVAVEAAAVAVAVVSRSSSVSCSRNFDHLLFTIIIVGGEKLLSSLFYHCYCCW